MDISPSELETFLARPTPRKIPAAIRKKAVGRSLRGFLLFGILFLVMGLPFSFIFIPRRLPDDLRLNKHARVAPNGLVLDKSATSMKENDCRVFKFEFSFTDQNDARHTGLCYAVNAGYQTDDNVPVEYLPDQPDTCRIVGCRLSPFGWGALFVLLFPAIGLVAIGVTMRIRHRILSLLTNGNFTTGYIESIKRTNVAVNNQRQYRITVSFNDLFTSRTGTYNVYGGDVEFIRRKQENGERVGLLYDPQNAKRILSIDQLLNGA